MTFSAFCLYRVPVFCCFALNLPIMLVRAYRLGKQGGRGLRASGSATSGRSDDLERDSEVRRVAMTGWPITASILELAFDLTSSSARLLSRFDIVIMT